MKEKNTIIHVALRIRPQIRINGHELDVINEHNKVFDKEGSVAVGKFGASWNQTRCDDFNNAAENGAKTTLFIVTKTDKGFKGFRSSIRAVLLSANKKGHAIVHPQYYNELSRQPALYNEALSAKPDTWFVLADRLEPCPLTNLKLVSNGRPLLHALVGCRASTMLVFEKRI